MKFASLMLMLCVCFLTRPAFAQSEPKQRSLLDEMKTEVIEIYSKRAIDFESENQVDAIGRLQSFEVTSEQFNQPTLKAMATFASGANPDSRIVSRALTLMKLSTLTAEQRVEAMLDCLVELEKRIQRLSRTTQGYRQLVSTKNGLSDQLGKHAEECYTQVLRRMRKSDQYCVDLLKYVTQVNDRSPEVLEIAMKTVRGDDTERADKALSFVATLIRDMQRAEAKRKAFAEAMTDPKAPVEDRYLRYAERIVSRMDTNGDGALDRAESQRMLMSPAASDIDNDGIITVEEYGRWMQIRSKK
ncbi:MAG: hypothetical protein AAFU85_03420 [Planctomycetota bacterium]